MKREGSGGAGPRLSLAARWRRGARIPERRRAEQFLASRASARVCLVRPAAPKWTSVPTRAKCSASDTLTCIRWWVSWAKGCGTPRCPRPCLRGRRRGRWAPWLCCTSNRPLQCSPPHRLHPDTTSHPRTTSITTLPEVRKQRATQQLYFSFAWLLSRRYTLFVGRHFRNCQEAWPMCNLNINCIYSFSSAREMLTQNIS